MKNLLTAGLLAISPLYFSQQMNYPNTPQGEHQDTYFGTQIADPYQWLENDHAPETKAWVDHQIDFTNQYMDKIPFRNEIKNRLSKKWNYEKQTAPFKEGKNKFFYKNNGLQAQSVLYKIAPNGQAEVFLDPNKFSEKGTTSLGQVSFSPSGQYVAYCISEGGSDLQKIVLMDVETKTEIGTRLEYIKFSGISWQGEQGFYYSSYGKPEGSDLSAKMTNHKVFFHTLGQTQSQDQLIKGGADFPRRYLSAYVTHDQHYLILRAANNTKGNEIYIKDLKKNSDFLAVQTGFDFDSHMVHNVGSTFFVETNKNANNNQLMSFKLGENKPWQSVIPETKEVLNVSTDETYFYASYLVDATEKIFQYDLNGQRIREVKLPGIGSVGGFSAEKDEDVYFNFTNQITPSSIYKFNPKDGSYQKYFSPKIDFKSEDYITEQVFYTSFDGTKIPMTISYKKSMQKNGQNPTILYAYGGFNISMTPNFAISRAIWMEMGGIYAVANIRGGGEYGQKWHDAGRLFNKKNCYQDFAAAGEYLKAKNYTSKGFLAIEGGSNGGLLVGTTMALKPDLCQVAIPHVGVMDMLKYQNFSSGAGWAYDFGTSKDSKEMFDYLKSYSPLHNLKANTCYPATLVTTGDHDDRVVPAHSFKFAAELQKQQACAQPTLIRISKDAGHGAGKSTQQVIDENADIMAFALQNMGVKSIK
jgi:prolyl oligopeptidase